MKKLMILMGILLLGAIVWLLFVKPYDYVAVIEAKTAPGVIDQVVKTWSGSLDNSEISKGAEMNQLRQILIFNDSTFQYDWQVVQLNDSVSEITVGVNGWNMKPRRRISNLLSETDFERRTKNTLLDFNEKLQEHLNSFRVSIEGEAELESTYCACVALESDQFEKARGMMKNYALLGSVILENKIELNGMPFIEITGWDRTNDRIKYNFCYPIIRKDSLPTKGPVLFKEFQGGPAIKATYNGNYISSDRAWYFLLHHAKKKGLKVRETPVEIFFDNPNMGGDAIKWRADIYMPLSE
mgnify:FL=1